jgi:hypothetical protein
MKDEKNKLRNQWNWIIQDNKVHSIDFFWNWEIKENRSSFKNGTVHRVNDTVGLEKHLSHPSAVQEHLQRELSTWLELTEN